MRKDRSLGLDELMIVNPGPTGAEAVFLGQDGLLYALHGLEVGEGPGAALGQLLLDEDGTLYQVQGLDETAEGSLFLGEDGTLYQSQDRGQGGLAGLAEVPMESVAKNGFGRFFLGDDGTLYEVVR